MKYDKLCKVPPYKNYYYNIDILSSYKETCLSVKKEKDLYLNIREDEENIHNWNLAGRIERFNDTKLYLFLYNNTLTIEGSKLELDAIQKFITLFNWS